MNTRLPERTISFGDLESLREYDGHEFVIRLNDDESGLNAFIAIHNSNLGVASGGTRMLKYDTEQEALQDVLNLSRAMSYKCAMARLPFGGGKAVIMVDETKNRDAVLFAYGRLLEKLRGTFKTGTDVGLSDDDVRKMATKTSHVLGVTGGDRGDLSTSSMAALGVFYSMKATLRQLYGHEDLQDVTVAIKGVGKLGGELARLVVGAGGKVTVADIDTVACQQLAERLSGISVVPVEAIRHQEVIIYAPCALGNEFNDQTVSELRCKAVVGGANNQLSSREVGKLLHDRGVLYAPDYVANAGGLIYVSDELEPGGFSQQRVLERTQAIQKTMEEIYQQSAVQHLPTNYIADHLAIARIKGEGRG